MPTTAIDRDRGSSTSPDIAEPCFRLLGPLEVVRDGHQVEVPRGRQQALLASLLLRPNEPIDAHTLIDQIWGTSRARADRSVLNVYVMRLRRSLGDHRHDLLRADGSGYRLAVSESNIDLCRFRELCSRASDFHQRGDRARERTALHRALALWRGEPLAGVCLPAMQSEVQPLLEEERLQALERRVDADLECREHHTLVRELQELVALHPFRERFWCQLMTALCRAGRRSEALEAYPTVRRLFVEELGIEPGAELRQLHQRILTQDEHTPEPSEHPISLELEDSSPPSSSRSTTRTTARTTAWSVPRESVTPLVPAQLPPDIAGFVGRTRLLRSLDESLLAGEPAPPMVITGPPGVGKTALAVHWASEHWASEHRERFADGQLYLDLRGYAEEAAVRPAEAIARFLRTLGVPAGQVPSDPTEAIALYRSLLADRRMLVLLDNAGSAGQVRPLLPNGGRSVVIVTSRDRLSGLVVREGAHSLALDVLPPADAHALLARILGTERLAAEPTATEALIRICDRLPLALRIAAANLLNSPDRPIADYVDELESRDRLDVLRVPNDPPSSLRASLACSYRSLTSTQRRAFALLGLLPGPVLCPDTVAALVQTGRADAERILDGLLAAHLLRPGPDGRYLLSGLPRSYAAGLARTELSGPDRAAALERLYQGPIRNAGQHAFRLYPDLDPLADPEPESGPGPEPAPADAVVPGHQVVLPFHPVELPVDHSGQVR